MIARHRLLRREAQLYRLIGEVERGRAYGKPEPARDEELEFLYAELASVHRELVRTARLPTLFRD